MRYLYSISLLLLLSVSHFSWAEVGSKEASSRLAVTTILPREEAKPLVSHAYRPVEIGEQKATTADYQIQLQRSFQDFGAFEVANSIEDAWLSEGIQEASLTDSVAHFIGKAKELTKLVREQQKYISFLGPQSLFELPAGINKNIGGLEYTIVFSEARMMPRWAELDVFMVFTIPQNGKELAFMARGIKFNKAGGLIGDVRLELLGDYAINMSGDRAQLILKGPEVQGNTVNGTSGNFVVFDCNGFVEMGLDAEVAFSRDHFILERPDGTVDTDNQVKARFTTTLSDWNDLIVEINMPNFRVRSLEGVGFTVSQAIFDFSDVRNAPGVVFPESYSSTQFAGGSRETWRGFYVRELSVRLPEQFNKRGNGQRTEFAAYDMLIDNQGFTGTLVASNLIQMNEGNMDAWSFSLEDLRVDIEANSLVAAGFGGRIQMPITEDGQTFDYSAYINPGDEYLFQISPAEELSFPMWKAGEVTLTEASYLEVLVINKKFYPKAHLHGSMNISAGGDGVSLADISFEALEIQTIKPYISIGAFSFGSEAAQQAMANFPVQIKNVNMSTTAEGSVGIGFDLIVNLQKAETGGFAGEASMVVFGELDEGEEIHKFKYERLQINRIAIDIDQGAFKFKGQLDFFREHEVFGRGFQGKLEAEFTPGIKVSAMALFGKVDNMRYWYVDALAELPSAVPIAPGFGLYGFGGGAYHHMRQAGFDPNVTDGLGVSRSGLRYAPDRGVFLGLKATVTFGTMPTKAAFNGEATFELAFNNNGGLDFVGFSGVGYFMTNPIGGKLADIKKKAGKLIEKAESMAAKMPGQADEENLDNLKGKLAAIDDAGQVAASVYISYDFRNKTLYGNLRVLVNIAGGLLKGVGPDGLAGEAVLYFAPKEWYIHIGTPDRRIGIQALGIAKMESYFMIGDNIPGSPPPDENVSEILGGVDLDYMRDENALGNGSGFAFGSRFTVDTGELTFLIFYARFKAGAGFDIMVKNYGPGVRCKGRSKPLGINGWYANGQAYAYFEGSIGIKVKLPFKKGKFEILSIGAAAVLQAKLPNPLWMRGMVGGRFSILGGLVKGNCRFEVTIGEQCEIIGGSVVSGIKVISDMTPSDNDSDVNVFNAAQAAFNMEINKTFEMVDVDDQLKKYRVVLDYFKVVDAGYEIPGTLEWNYDKDVVAFDAFDVLPPNKKLKAEVRVSFEVQEGGWKPVKVDGKVVTETKTVAFETGTAPDFIPQDNVRYSYPVATMYNFYPDEHGNGYIQLDKGQDYLFQIGQEWRQTMRFAKANGQKMEVNFSYDNAKNIINYTIPSGFAANTIYNWSILNVPRSMGPAVDANISDTESKVGGQELDVELSGKEAEGTINRLQEKAIYTSYFKSSKFKTFAAKIDALELGANWLEVVQNGVARVGVNFVGPEFFDQYESGGLQGLPPGVQMTAVKNNDWLTKKVIPMLYTNSKYKPQWRSEEPLGTPPLKAIFFMHRDQDRSLSEGEVLSNTPLGINDDWGEIHYDLAVVGYKDYVDFQNQAVRVSYSRRTAWEHKLVENPFPGIRTGAYNLTVQYVLPGLNKVTTSRNLRIVYQ